MRKARHTGRHDIFTKRVEHVLGGRLLRVTFWEGGQVTINHSNTVAEAEREVIALHSPPWLMAEYCMWERATT